MKNLDEFIKDIKQPTKKAIYKNYRFNIFKWFIHISITAEKAVTHRINEPLISCPDSEYKEMVIGVVTTKLDCVEQARLNFVIKEHLINWLKDNPKK